MTNSKSIITIGESLCCDSDVETVTDHLANIDGVEEARGSTSSNKVTVTYRGDSVSEDDITAELGDAGLSVENAVTFDVSDA